MSVPCQSEVFKASNYAADGKFHLLLAASGSVATIKIPNIIQGLAGVPHLAIRIVITKSAAEFLQGQSKEQPSLATLSSYPNVEGIYHDKDEWAPPWTRGAPILHIELRRWAHLLVIAPLSANTLAKIANGLCDNLLTSIVRAWEVVDTVSNQGRPVPKVQGTKQKPIVVAPSMNTAMWKHPVTSHQLGLFEEGGTMFWIEILRPIEKSLACGDTGDGAMCEWTTIARRISTHHGQFFSDIEQAKLDHLQGS